MGRYRVDPRRVRVVQMADGTRYRPSRDGVVVVAPRHDAEMARSPARRSWQAEASIEPIRTAVVVPDGRDCPTCGWSGWAWSTRCGRCGEVFD